MLLESLSDVGSREASGELLGDPVDMGEGDEGAGAVTPVTPLLTVVPGTVGAVGASSRSKNGFLLLFGDENGFVLPIVANFCPELKGLLSDDDVDDTGAAADCGGELLGATKLFENGLVLLATVLLVSVTLLLVTAAAPPLVRKLSEKSVSLCSPARPFSEK